MVGDFSSTIAFYLFKSSGSLMINQSQEKPDLNSLFTINSFEIHNPFVY